MDALINLDKPIVAAVHGATIGGGTTMLTHCDFLYAGESAPHNLTERKKMPEMQTPKPKPAGSGTKNAAGRLFFLDGSAGRILAVSADGSDKKVLVTGCRIPDGVVIDAEAGHLYWTNMGVPSLNDGSIERVDLDGGNRTTIVPEGATFTPKQLQLDKAAGKLYWCDREGMRVMRVNLDGSGIETLVRTGRTDADRLDATRWCVGIALDRERGQIYWTQKGADNAGKGRILRAGIEIPRGETADTRTDIEVLYDGLPEP